MEKRPKEMKYYSKKLYDSLFSLRGELSKRKDTALEHLESDYTSGDKIPRSRWPREYKEMELPNLYRIEVGKGHRLLYSIIKHEGDISVLIVDFDTHKGYDRKFKYST